MIFKNYYKILGLTQNMKSTQDEIKTAYREQAKKYHPDVNVNNKNAEERFKDINEAYNVLSDPIQKRKYDRSWYNYVGKKIKKEKMSEKEVRVNDIVNIFFGANANVEKKSKQSDKEPVRGIDIETQIDISIKEAFDGIEKKLSLASVDEKNTVVNIKIPSGIQNGEVIRIEGKGKNGQNGGKNGNLLVKINIVNNSVFSLNNDDIYEKIYLAPWDAALGTKISVNSIDGQVSILIPKGTQNGDKISIPNKGYYCKDTRERGKFVVVAQIVIPKNLSDKEKKLFAELRKVSEFNPKILHDKG